MAKVDGRTRSGRLRKMAIMPKPQQVISMCREALACGVKAEYVLFDSWFFSAHMLASLHELGLSVISLVKSNLKFALTENGIALTQRQLQQIIGQRQPKRRKDILGDSLAFFHGIAVKLVFVRNRANPSTIITIVSTDLQLCAEDVVRLYINRWKIETCYFAQKQYLGLDSECQAHNFDTIHAFLQLTNIRYVIAEFSKRLEEDPRTMGELFRDTVELLHVLPFVDAINKLFEAVNTTLRQKMLEANVIVPGREQEAMDIITDTLSSWLNGTIKYIQAKVSQLRLSLNQS